MFLDARGRDQPWSSGIPRDQSLKKIVIAVLLFREQEHWIKDWAMIVYPYWRGGVCLVSRDCPRCPTRKRCSSTTLQGGS